MGPVELIVVVRDNDLSGTRPRRCGRGPCTAVMNDRGYAWEQLSMTDIPDREAVAAGFAWYETSPALRKDRTQPQGAGRFQQPLSGLVGGSHAAKPQVDGRRPIGEKDLELLRQRHLVGNHPGAGLHDLHASERESWREHGIGSQPWTIRKHVVPYARHGTLAGFRPLLVQHRAEPIERLLIFLPELQVFALR